MTEAASHPAEPAPSGLSRRALLRAGVHAGVGVGLGTTPLLWLAACSNSPARTLDRMVEAERAKRSAGALAALDPDSVSPTARAGVIVKQEAWSFDRASGRVFETAHFRVFTTLDDSELLDRLPRFLEGSLLRYRTALIELPEPTSKLVTYAMNNRSQWATLTRELMGRQAGIYLQITRGGFAANGKGVYFDLGPRDTLAVAAHEGWHQYTQAVFAEPLPIWLDEGLAAWHEGFRWDRERGPLFLPWSNPARFDRLRQVVQQDRLLPLPQLLASRPQDLIATSDRATLDYYAQVWAFTHFLVDGMEGVHRVGLINLLADASAGTMMQQIRERFGRRAVFTARTRRTGSAPLLTYLTKSDPAEDPDAALDRLDTQYQLFTHAITRPGTREQILKGHAPLL